MWARRVRYVYRAHRGVNSESDLSVGPISSTQPTTHNPIELHTTNNKRSGTRDRPTVLIYHSQWLSRNRVLLQRSQEAYQALEFLEMFLTHDPTDQKATNLDPTQPKQPNPWVDPTHEQLCGELLFFFKQPDDRLDVMRYVLTRSVIFPDL